MKALKLINNKTGFKFDNDSIIELQKLRDKEHINLQIIDDKKYRSIKQNSYYWNTILTVIRYYLPENLLNPIPTDNKQLHNFLMFGYGVSNNLITIIKYKDLNIPIRPSWSFQEMTEKQANEYLDFVKKWVESNLDNELDYLIKKIVV